MFVGEEFPSSRILSELLAHLPVVGSWTYDFWNDEMLSSVIHLWFCCPRVGNLQPEPNRRSTSDSVSVSYHSGHDWIELLARGLTTSDPNDIFCGTWIRYSVPIPLSIELIASALEAIISESRLPRIKVGIPVTVAPGIERSWWLFTSHSELLSLFLFKNFGETNTRLGLSSDEISRLSDQRPIEKQW